MALIDKGSSYFDTDMKPTHVFDAAGSLNYAFYCPYIPKILVEDEKEIVFKTRYGLEE